MRPETIHRFTLVMGIAVACTGCRSARVHSFDPDAIRSVLDRQIVAWNRGDIEGFMDAYDRSPELTFSSGGRVTRGWQPTLDGYHKRYPTRKAMGRLTFSDLEITELGPGAALVLGRWNLDRGEPVGGTFSLVLRRQADRWMIIHDHTSRAPTESAAR